MNKITHQKILMAIQFVLSIPDINRELDKRDRDKIWIVITLLAP